MITAQEQRDTSTTVPWYKVALSKRWLSYLLLAAIFAGACIALSTWQFNRRAEAQLEIQRVLANYESQPIALSEALPTLTSFDPDDKWIPVAITGTYLPEDQFIVRSRPREQQAGVEVLTPLKDAQGNIFIINRGWLPANTDPSEAYVLPAPPQGTVTVVARLKGSEPAIAGRSAADNQLATIELGYIQEVLNSPTYTGAYGLLDSETPTPIDETPLPALKPSLDEGAHLSYALQWIMFGLLAFVALVWAIRNELKIRNAQSEESQEHSSKHPRRTAKLSEEEIEDSILDRS